MKWGFTVCGCGVVLAAAVCMGAKNAEPEVPLPKLHVINSRHYEVHYDIGGQFAHELAQRMDTMYGEYEKALPGFSQPKDSPPLPAYLFAKQADYITYTRSPHTSGVFVMAEHPFLAGHVAGGRDDLRTTLQHEAFHQFAYFAICKDLPPWINEGLAQVFEEGVWTGDHFWMGQVPPARVREIQVDIKEHHVMPFKKFMTMSLKEWNGELGSREEQDRSNYSQAWAMAQFLMESGRATYKGKMMHFLEDMHGGDDAATATAKEFPDLEGFQRDFAAWVMQLHPTLGATMVERQRMLGWFLIDLHKDGRHFKTFDAFRDFCVSIGYRVMSAKGRFHWESSTTPIEYFQDAAGRTFGGQQLFFDRTAKGPLPDIVCLPSGQDQFRTHFYKNGEEGLMPEVLMQKPGEGPQETK